MSADVHFTDEERALMRETADRLACARLSVPAMMTLETISPMNMVTASMLHMLSPVWRTVLPASRIDRVAGLLERREAIPEFIRIIDEAEERHRIAARDAKRQRKQERRSGAPADSPHEDPPT